MTRAILLAVCLLAAAPALAAEPGQMPNRFVRVEPFDVGTGAWSFEGRLLRATYTTGRLRAGIGLVDVYAVIDFCDAGMWAPVHVGYTVWSNPRRTLFFYGVVPDIYVELSGSPFTPRAGRLSTGLGLKLSAVFDVDYYGVGAGVEFGLLRIPHGYCGQSYGYSTGSYLCLRLRALPFSIGL